MEALKKRLNARIEYAKFLQDTVKEMAKEVQNSRSGEIKRTAKDLDDFMNKVRRGARVSNDEILAFAKLFNDELTLDNISQPFHIAPVNDYVQIYGYQYVRTALMHIYAICSVRNFRMIKEDDKMIQTEGIDSLSEEELRQACRDRGLLGLLSVDEMRKQV
ncbi:hypothetical protein OROGR_009130 [Orobanche gracilis]